jgi:hypothetical protein
VRTSRKPTAATREDAVTMHVVPTTSPVRRSAPPTVRPRRYVRVPGEPHAAARSAMATTGSTHRIVRR